MLELFQDLQREHGFACLFISHDLAVVEMLSDRIAVMHNGGWSRSGTRAQVGQPPAGRVHAATLAAVPVPDPVAQQERRLTRDALLEAQRDELERDEIERADELADASENADSTRTTIVDQGPGGHTTGRGF